MKTECPNCKSLSLEIEGLIDHTKMLQNARDRFDRKCEQLRRLMLDRDREVEEIKKDLLNAIQWIGDGNDQEGMDLIVMPLRDKYFASQREAAESDDEKPDGQAENTLLDQP